MLKGHDLICISSIDWDFIWQGHQEIMSTFAGQGNRVLFIENTGVRTPTMKDLPRVWQRVHNWWRSTKGFRQERTNLFVYSPLILPFPYARLARWINRWLLLRPLNRWMRMMAFRPSTLWTFLPTPLATDLIHELNPEITIYYCIDDLASSSPAARRIRESERTLFQQADLIFVTSTKLQERARRFNERVHLFPFGVDFQAFEAVRNESVGLPQELHGIARPIVGYVGGLHQWINQPLLAEVMARLPEVSFVFVGPLQTDVSRLRQFPNAHFIGSQAHDDVPRFVKGFDVGMIPYCLSDYTAHVYPTKLNEYLAMGLPVVATDLPEIRRFNTAHGPLVGIARDAESFAQLTRSVLQLNGPDVVQRRIDAARGNSWHARIAQMSELIEGELASRRQAGVQWQESLLRLYRTVRRRMVKAVLLVGLLYYSIFHTPLMWWLAEPLRVAQPPRQADAIVVFAGGVGESGKAGEGYQERVKQAVDLYRQGLAPRMLFSSGYTFVFREAEIMRELAEGEGVPADAIFLETVATNTVENVKFVNAMLRQHGWRRILLVSSPYHMRRADWTFRKMAPDITVIPTPVPESRFYDRSLGVTVEQIKGILHEYAALLWYRWKGWL